MSLAYEDRGKGRPVVVLLHGFPLNRSMWAEQVAILGKSFRVITPDLRGHGESAVVEGAHTMDAMAGDVIALLDALQISEPVVLGGLSMGGYVALALIARFPERVRALMLLDTRATPDTPEAARGREELAQHVESSGTVTRVIDQMVPNLFVKDAGTRYPEKVALVRAMAEATSPQSVARTLRGLAARPDRTPMLHTIAFPTLVLVGEHDAITPVEMANVMVREIPGAKLAVIEGAGHMAPLENPQASNLAIGGFLDALI